MTNLLKETMDSLKYHDKTAYDVKWVGSRDGKFAISFEEFVDIANINYDSGYGSQKIASDLVIVGDNWWMDRYEYDGSESWDFHTKPTCTRSKAKKFSLVTKEGVMWDNLEVINRPEIEEEK